MILAVDWMFASFCSCLFLFSFFLADSSNLSYTSVKANFHSINSFPVATKRPGSHQTKAWERPEKDTDQRAKRSRRETAAMSFKKKRYSRRTKYMSNAKINALVGQGVIRFHWVWKNQETFFLIKRFGNNFHYVMELRPENNWKGNKWVGSYRALPEMWRRVGSFLLLDTWTFFFFYNISIKVFKREENIGRYGEEEEDRIRGK